MSVCRILIVSWCVMACAAADGAPARFWLSLNDAGPLDPDVPVVTGVLGAARRVHVWAQPQTTGSTQMQNVSLNVVSPSTGFDIDPNTIVVHNPTYTTARPRFEFVSDSTDGLLSVDASLPTGMNRGIAGLQGFTINPTAGDGFGGVCDAADTACGATSSADAWLFASFTLTPTANSGTAELYLQVGLNGMNHTGENPADMSVKFGVESVGPAPADYDPSMNLDVTLAGDDSDAVFTLVKPGDYDGDGDVDAMDYDEWRDLYGTADSAADGNSDGVVDAADYAVWRNNFPMSPAAVAASVAPAPGGGWLMIWLLLARASSGRLRGASACG